MHTSVPPASALAYPRVVRHLYTMQDRLGSSGRTLPLWTAGYYYCRGSVRKKIMIPIEHEPFIGRWRERGEMNDGTAWVRQMRAAEWAHEDARRSPSPISRPALPPRSKR